MTTEQFIEKQRAIIKQIIDKDIPLKRAAASTLAMQAQRIFVDGHNSTGSDIGRYDSTKPLYVNPKTTAGTASKLGTPRGKNGQTTFKNGKKHKTVWVESYKSLKGKIGQKNDKVRLVLSGDLKSDFSSSQLVKISTHEYYSGVKRDENIGKAKGQEKRFGKIFEPTKKEIENFFDVAQKEYNLILNA